MECAGISEAGGVKNVSYSLCKEFSKAGNNVVLFIPRFKCTTVENISGFKQAIKKLEIGICGKQEKISFSGGIIKNTKVQVIFVEHPCFAEKDEIYVYSQNEQNQNPEHIKGSGHTDVNFLDTIFSKAVTEFGKTIPENQKPDIIHCHDASTAVLPAFINQNKEFYTKTKCAVTIHNAGPAYHHEYRNLDEACFLTGLDRNILENSMNQGRVEPYLIGSHFSELLTVSKEYAEELTDPRHFAQTDGLSSCFHDKNIKITGITNGIDFERYNPRSKKISELPFSFNPLNSRLKGKFKCRDFLYEYSSKNQSDLQEYEPHLKDLEKFGWLEKSDNEKEILLSFHGRIVKQKGIHLLCQAFRNLQNRYKNIKLVAAGQGNIEDENLLINLTREFPGKAVYFKGYNKKTSRLIVAASDFIVLPSEFEPCCLEDFIAQIFGTIPVAHRTGGLNKIIDEKTGFLFEEYSSQALEERIVFAVKNYLQTPDKMKQMISYTARYIKNEFSWKKVCRKEYLNFFEKILKKN